MEECFIPARKILFDGVVEVAIFLQVDEVGRSVGDFTHLSTASITRQSE